MKRFFRKQWVHYLLLGGLLTLIMPWLPFFREIPLPPTVSAEQRQVITDNFFRQIGRHPDADELQSLVDAEIDQQLLYRAGIDQGLHLVDPLIWQRLIRNMRFLGLEGEDGDLLDQALEFNMHLNDPVVRRRVLQVMEMRAAARAGQAPEGDLRIMWQQRIEEFTNRRIAFDHIFFEGSDSTRSKAYSSDPVAETDCDRLSFDSQSGDNYPIGGNRVPLKTRNQIAKQFGGKFADEVFAIDDIGCYGPLWSSFGSHFVHILKFQVEVIPFEQARAQLVLDWQRDKGRLLLRQEAIILRQEHGLPE